LDREWRCDLRVNQPSGQTSQPTGQQYFSAKAASARPFDNYLPTIAPTKSSGTALAIASIADCGIVSLSMYRWSLISSVFDLDQCFLVVMSAF